MDPIAEYKLLSTRRHLLGSMAGGIGAAALTDLLGSGAATASPIPSPTDPLAVRPPHFAPRAKRMIVIHLTGSPPHLDMYDHKPQLVKRDGE